MNKMDAYYAILWGLLWLGHKTTKMIDNSIAQIPLKNGTQREWNRHERNEIYIALRTQRDVYSTCSRWGLAVGVTHILAFALGVTQILVFLDSNKLISPTQNSRVGSIDQRKAPTWEFRSGI